MKHMPLSVLAAAVFAASACAAAASLQHTLAAFATEAGIEPWIFVVVPGLFAALYATLIYGTREAARSSTRESLSRGLLVGLLTWPSMAALATAVWFSPESFSGSFSTLLLATAVVGGGPMLLATLAAGALTGFVIRLRLR
jgi:hypothetical protein